MKIGIVSGGMLDEKFISQYLDDSFDYVIAADRGLNYFYKNKLKPDEIIGDFDSVDKEVLSYYEERMPKQIKKYPSKKDETDTELAICSALKKNPDEIHLLAATGGRLDHLLGSLKNLGLGLEKQVPIYLVDKKNRIRMIAEGKTVLNAKEAFGTYFSIIPYEHTLKGLTIRGAMYETDGITLEGFISRGVSNQMVKNFVEIEIKEGKAYLLETKDQ
ncbi:MAG: thiamine diphosphokinase [Eubacterium sp.]|nr:thiamine diphosphokinase [Eubacterium sp.]